jgi:molybdopterin biosynthesis enzyme
VSDAGLISTLTKSNGIVIIEDGSGLMKGEMVDVILLRNVCGVST